MIVREEHRDGLFPKTVAPSGAIDGHREIDGPGVSKYRIRQMRRHASAFGDHFVDPIDQRPRIGNFEAPRRRGGR